MKQVLVLINAKSGMGGPYRYITAIEKVWDTPAHDVSFQFSQSEGDGAGKVRRALERGIGTILVVGGDGMVNTIGRELIGTDAVLGVIPAGSGNGFARHFGIPLNPAAAAKALLKGIVKPIDAGYANGRPFFITCSMAWDAALVETFEKYPFRGVVPYVLAGAQTLLEYRPQLFEVNADGQKLEFKEPMVFTIANLSQFGSDVHIAPDARADSGDLELVTVTRRNLPFVMSQIHRFIENTFHKMPQVTTLHFKEMTVTRRSPGPIQLDGEVLDAEADVIFKVTPAALNVLVPA
ncbi:MAG: hypothetical protein K9M45_04600 [Kiritimatiellales bacterium]|nr:hypothetical protein [Kiritimatiellales bacterium]